MKSESLDSLPLRDIQLPEDGLWWPPAPGWWLLLLTGVFMLLLGVQKYRRRRQREQRIQRRQVVAEAQQVLQEIAQESDSQAAIQALSVLLRRTAMSLYGRQQVAGLSGLAWLQFLDASGQTRDFTAGSGQLLLDQPFRRRSIRQQEAHKPLITLVQRWLEAQLRTTGEVESV